MTVTVNEKTRNIFPPGVRRRVGIKTGSQLEIRVSGSVVSFIPKLPAADDKYTPEQRRLIDAQLAEGLDDIRRGRVSRRFDTVDEMLASLKTGKSSLRRKSRR